MQQYVMHGEQGTGVVGGVRSEIFLSYIFKENLSRGLGGKAYIFQRKQWQGHIWHGPGSPGQIQSMIKGTTLAKFVREFTIQAYMAECSGQSGSWARKHSMG